MRKFLAFTDHSRPFQQLETAIHKGQTPALAVGVSGIHKAQLVHALTVSSEQPALIVVPDESIAIRICEDINALAGEPLAVHYPSREFTFRNVQGVSQEYEHARLNILSRLCSEEQLLVVCSVEASVQHTMPPAMLMAKTAVISVGDTLPVENLVEKLITSGYTRCDQVEGICQFSVRGGILDFFPPHSTNPVRIELWGDEIDTISLFSADTQRRIESVEQTVISPAREALAPDVERLISLLESSRSKLRGKLAEKAKEQLTEDIETLKSGLTLCSLDKYMPLLYETGATVFDYMQHGRLFLCEPVSCRETLQNAQWQLIEDIKIMLEEGILFKGCTEFAQDFSYVEHQTTHLPSILMDTFVRSVTDIRLKELYDFQAIQLSSWGGEFALLLEDVQDYLHRNYCVVIFAGTQRAAQALLSDFQKEKISVDLLEDISSAVPNKVFITTGSLSAGFEYPEQKLAVITHAKTVPQKARRKKHPQAGKHLRNLSDLNPGDHVVHVAHGIGVFEGIVKREIQGLIKDYIKIRYAGTDALFVPVTQLDLVSKYIGARDDGNVKLNKLNSAEWQKTRQRVKAAVQDMAKELIKLYSERIQIKGYAFSEDTDWQKDFEERFAYQETDDQLRCIEEIKHDMEGTVPMDRLLCGDVGFGKTEVAIRAVFKAVMDSKQCAVLVPTTILAWQHFQTFKKRMEGFPIKIELLSRFRSAKEQQEILRELRRGEIDVIIGTHRLVQKDVQFKDLGLCIIDEEQRFGVAHKEKFKQLRSSVDVLTLSATPIPRTLNMAMSGIRDMSLIEEAPQDRHPVQTYVIEHDLGIIAEAIRKEMRRGGQVFYLHNRVDSIDNCVFLLSKLLPNARIVSAHGKMSEEQISGVWRQLVDHEIDVLVCTTIIETGVDVSNCNTLIIEDADRMGLSQLYQIRGRVGRTNRRAYAYLTFKKGKALTDIATKRLSAIREFTSFGSGFRIAMRDLEIRGAGNILGSQQHGHMEAVGYDMYLKLLGEAVSEQRGETPDTNTTECMVDIRIGAHIPENYIDNLAQRIDVYKKIASIQNEDDSMDVIDELIDRFGEPPEAVKGLVDVALVRNTASRMGIDEISQRDDVILLFPHRLDLEKASTLASRLKGRVMVSAGTKPYISVKIPKGTPPLLTIRQALGNMVDS